MFMQGLLSRLQLSGHPTPPWPLELSCKGFPSSVNGLYSGSAGSLLLEIYSFLRIFSMAFPLASSSISLSR